MTPRERYRVAGQEGLEPPTPGFGDRCSTIELLAFIELGGACVAPPRPPAGGGGGGGPPPPPRPAIGAGQAQPCSLTISTMSSPASVGFWPTFTPAAASASILPLAVPLPPDTMAPAWPIFLPAGAVTPAT
jgi:hypothetical protein